MNFYLSAVDDLLKHPNDQLSIGLIICKTKDQIVAEYALRNSNTPIGISEYTLAESLPKNFKGGLPTIEELESELGRDPGVFNIVLVLSAGTKDVAPISPGDRLEICL